MNKKTISALVTLLAFFSACMEEDLSKLSNQINMDVQLAIPLIRSTTTLYDLLPIDDHIQFDDDNFIRIVYRDENFTSVNSDSLLDVENQPHSVKSMELGPIEIDDYEDAFRMTILQLSQNIEDTELGSNFPAGVEYSAEHGSAYFPPIPPQSAGYYSRPGPDAFKYVYVESGIISIELYNEMPVEITHISMTLMNTVDSSVIGLFYFNNVPIDQTQSYDLYVELDTIHSDLIMFVDILELEGSGTNPFNESTYVPLNYDQGVDVTVITRDMIVKEGLVRFPEKEGPSDTIIVDLQFDNGMELTLMDVIEGDFAYSFESSVKTDITLDVQIPSLKNDMGEMFTYSILVSNTQSVGEQFNSYPIDGYSFDLSDAANKLEVYYSTTTVATPESEDHVVFSEQDTVRVSIGIDNMEFSYIEGYFGEVERTIDESELNLDFSALQQIATGIQIETPQLTFFSDNTMGIPFEINLNLSGSNNGETVNLSGPALQIPANQTSNSIYNQNNSQLVSLIALNPEQMVYSGSAISNPLGNQGIPNFISPGTGLEIGFEMDLPLHLRIDNAEMRDTLSLNFENLNTNNTSQTAEIIESAILHFNIENGFPFDCSVKVFMVDSVSNVILDSLELNLLEAAIVNEYGKVETPMQYHSELELGQDQIQALINANRAVVSVSMSTYEYETTAVKLYTDYEFILGIGVISNLENE
jgi:hypothetical protein